MKIESPRFGTLEIEPSKIIEFPNGLAGFEECRRFYLFHQDGEASAQPNYFILQSLDDPAVAFHVTDPALLGFSYQIELSDEQVELLKLSDASDVAVAVMLVKEDSGSAPNELRANLKTPLIINTRSQRGLQHAFAQIRYIVAKA